jgi:DNA-binding MarR family transcriptional regulator
MAEEPLKTSAIAEYQGALRPTMTHRTNHLAKLGYIDRGEGQVDRRNIVCQISEDGREQVRKLSELTRAQIMAGQSLARTSAERVRKYVDAMGSVYCTAGELVLLALHMDAENECTITNLVDKLGLLQPTVSMSVSSLAKDGLVNRNRGKSPTASSSFISLTDEGAAVARRIAERITAIIVRRRPRA